MLPRVSRSRRSPGRDEECGCTRHTIGHAWRRCTLSRFVGLAICGERATQHLSEWDRHLNTSSAEHSLYVRVTGKGADSGLSCAVTLAYELSPPSS